MGMYNFVKNIKTLTHFLCVLPEAEHAERSPGRLKGSIGMIERTCVRGRPAVMKHLLARE